LNNNYTPVREYALKSDGIGGCSKEYFEPHIQGARSIALLCHHCDIHAVDWSEYVSDLSVFCFFQGYPHTNPRFHKALATRMLAAGALSVSVYCYRQMMREWQCYSITDYKPEVIDVAA